MPTLTQRIKKAAIGAAEFTMEALAEAEVDNYPNSGLVSIVVPAAEMQDTSISRFCQDLCQGLGLYFVCQPVRDERSLGAIVFTIRHIESDLKHSDGSYIFADVHLRVRTEFSGDTILHFDFVDISYCGWTLPIAKRALNQFGDAVSKMSSDFPTVTLDGIDL